MKYKLATAAFLILFAASFVEAQNVHEIVNPAVDMKRFLKLARKQPSIEKSGG